jgi:hypothetical protein
VVRHTYISGFSHELISSSVLCALRWLGRYCGVQLRILSNHSATNAASAGSLSSYSYQGLSRWLCVSDLFRSAHRARHSQETLRPTPRTPSMAMAPSTSRPLLDRLHALGLGSVRKRAGFLLAGTHQHCLGYVCLMLGLYSTRPCVYAFSSSWQARLRSRRLMPNIYP